MSAEEDLKTIAAEVNVCVKCKLHIGRKKAVPGEGPANAKIMFIGEGPGFYENEQGRPFVGAGPARGGRDEQAPASAGAGRIGARLIPPPGRRFACCFTQNKEPRWPW